MLFNEEKSNFFSGSGLWGWCLCRVWWICFQTPCWRSVAHNFAYVVTRLFLTPLFYSVFFPIAEALSRLNAVITHPNAHHSDNVMAYDNAVSALGKICQFNRDSINAAQVCLHCRGSAIFIVFIMHAIKMCLICKFVHYCLVTAGCSCLAKLLAHQR